MNPSSSDTAGRPRIRTTVGVPVGRSQRLSPEARAAVRLLLARGPALAVFDHGIAVGAFTSSFDAVGRVRDLAGELDRAHLMLIDDTELLDALDRDAELKRRVA